MYCRVAAEMGIRGLTTFVDAHPELLTDLQLHDTRIVIDGNNLYHFLYYHFHLPCEYGGDYDQFARSCETFFSALDSCNVTPYVVFDGAYASDGNKFQTSLARARERVHMSNIVAHGRHAKMLPVLAQLCFVHVLQRLGVECVTCDFEADCQIAALARHWSCPVLTNDSDFFVYDIPAGVILLDYLNLRCKCSKQQSGVVCRYLDAQIFYCQKFMKFLHVNNHCLVILFATLLGNDIVDGRNFENFFQHVKLPKAHSRYTSGIRQRKIAGLIAWLQAIHSVRDAILCILAKLPENRRKSVESLINLSLECYSDPSSDLDEYFDADSEQKKSVVRRYGECVLPDWFLVSASRGTIPTAMLNVLASRRLLLLSQIEASSEVSSYRCSQRLRQIAYGIALSDINIAAVSDSRCVACVNEFDRECKALKMCCVKPITELNGICVPHLSEISQMDSRHRFLLLLESLETSVDCVFDLMTPDAQFLVAVLCYWVHHANAKISKLHIHALLLCFVKLGALDTYLLVASQSKTVAEAVHFLVRLVRANKLQQSVISDLTVTAGDESDLFVVILRSLSASLDDADTDQDNDEQDYHTFAVDQVKKKLFQFESTPHHNHAVTYNSAVVYAFAEFQSCFMSAACVASLLGLTVPDPASVFSGTVLYNLMRELRSRSNPDIYITELLGGPSSVLPGCYLQLMNAVLFEVPEGRLEVVSCRPKKKSKKSRKNSGSAPAADVCDEFDAQLVDSAAESYVVNCDVDNRFSGLSLGEE